jgi:hypothetical protein
MREFMIWGRNNPRPSFQIATFAFYLSQIDGVNKRYLSFII